MAVECALEASAIRPSHHDAGPRAGVPRDLATRHAGSRQPEHESSGMRAASNITWHLPYSPFEGGAANACFPSPTLRHPLVVETSIECLFHA
jgi:hypothetical protein